MSSMLLGGQSTMIRHIPLEQWPLEEDFSGKTKAKLKYIIWNGRIPEWAVFFNVRNVNYNGYKRQVENQYYFEDGVRLLGINICKGSDKGEKIDFDKEKLHLVVIGEVLLLLVGQGIQVWLTAMSTTLIMDVYWGLNE